MLRKCLLWNTDHLMLMMKKEKEKRTPSPSVLTEFRAAVSPVFESQRWLAEDRLSYWFGPPGAAADRVTGGQANKGAAADH